MVNEPIFGELRSGYVRRGESGLPRQGRRQNWHVSHNYKKDKEILGQAIDDTSLRWKYILAMVINRGQFLCSR
ncbi:hypothetical protein AFK69_04440 [Xenorhabdus sp. GDc328]|nr:hypothetical protein AAY47_14750 [Xenorhabdus griffiniae]KOP34494.1 hypothetical protein AFK69_04440 [Xenorhabdus sp. GDc328]